MAKSTTNTKRTRDAKINAAIGTTAMKIAKEQNEPLLKRKDMFKRKFMETKAKIIQKYASKARAEVHSGKTNSKK